MQETRFICFLADDVRLSNDADFRAEARVFRLERVKGKTKAWFTRRERLPGAIEHATRLLSRPCGRGMRGLASGDKQYAEDKDDHAHTSSVKYPAAPYKQAA